MMLKPFACLALSLTPLTALAQEAMPPSSGPDVGTAITLSLGSDISAEQRIIAYTCEETEPFSVRYINAAPNFLALVPIEGETLVMAAVLSGSGARYTAGQYEWWTTGPDGTLRDLTSDEDAPALATCSEFSNVP